MRAQEQDLTNRLQQARTELAALQASPPPAPTTPPVPAGPVAAPTKTLLGPSSAPAPALPQNPIAVVSCTSTLLMPNPCRPAPDAATAHEASSVKTTPAATPVATQRAQVEQRVHDLQQQLEAAHLRAATGGGVAVTPMSASATAAAQANLADARQQLADVTQRLNAVAATASLATRGSAGVPPSRFALTDVPPDYLALYQRAAATCPGLSWTVLAGIGSIESNHGRSTLPGVRSGTNSVGAMGPMQFLGGSWAAYGVDADGNGVADVYQPADAIFGAANYLCHDSAGDPAHLRDAIWSYNHADWYVNRVLDVAIRYGSNGLDSVATSTTPAQVVANPNIALTPDARNDLLSGKIDPRVANLLAAAASTHRLTVSVIKTGHSMYVSGTNRVSNHYVGRAVDISAVDGVDVTASNAAALDLSLAILTSTSSIRPDEFGSPWLQLSGFPGAFTDDDHQDHLHVGWDS
jgi:membrane-bound lytic murein transglycosylase B